MRNITIRSEEVSTVNTILQSIEEILDGTTPEVIDIPDYLPQMIHDPMDGGTC